MYYREWTSDGSGHFVETENPLYRGLPFEPVNRHSRVRGVIVNEGGGQVPQMQVVGF